MRKEVVSPLVHLLCMGGGKRARDENTCEEMFEEHECMRQTHTTQVLHYKHYIILCGTSQQQ